MTRLYWLNAALLAAHELDAAAWRAWELFPLPGGARTFTLVHLAGALLFLWGYEAVVQDRRSAVAWSASLAACALAAAGLHGWLVWSGVPAARVPVALGLLGATVLASLLQLAGARFEHRIRQRSMRHARGSLLQLR